MGLVTDVLYLLLFVPCIHWGQCFSQGYNTSPLSLGFDWTCWFPILKALAMCVLLTTTLGLHSLGYVAAGSDPGSFTSLYMRLLALTLALVPCYLIAILSSMWTGNAWLSISYIGCSH